MGRHSELVGTRRSDQRQAPEAQRRHDAHEDRWTRAVAFPHCDHPALPASFPSSATILPILMTSKLHPEVHAIFLTGFMGAGKSTVGPLLGEHLAWRFVDLDEEIERQAGRRIAQI